KEKYVTKENPVNPTTHHQTNYPYQRSDLPGDTNAPSQLLFRYYKKFLTDADRKNEPKNNPHTPRLYPKAPKDEDADRSLRKWRKGAVHAGEPLGKGGKETRINAGGAMAKALNDFKF